MCLSVCEVYGEPADGGAGDGIPAVLARISDDSRAGLCTHPASLHDADKAGACTVPRPTGATHSTQPGTVTVRVRKLCVLHSQQRFTEIHVVIINNNLNIKMVKCDILHRGV